ncbi:MAG TPA: hypothetical protein DEP05_07820 [Betaproteobacteria bacterium]|nr:hypothetical protein [Betaproteobacteria bacterium]
MNPFRLLLPALLVFAAAPATAAGPAATVKSVTLRKAPFIDAAAVARLPRQTRVTVIKRQGAWTKVHTTDDRRGWLRMLDLDFGENAKKGDSGLGALLNVARTGSSGMTVATGVRGLSEEDLTSARPNPAALKQLDRYTVSAAQARRFARRARLQTQNIHYLAAPSGETGNASAPADSAAPFGDLP